MHSHVFNRLSSSPWATWQTRLLVFSILLICLITCNNEALAHAVTAGDKGYIQEISGVNILPFMYLGAKHMITGYDHILFLFGVIFFLYRIKHIGVYVSLFALGHSTTMILGVYFNIGMNSYLIDAIIGLSVVYKAFRQYWCFSTMVRVSHKYQNAHVYIVVLTFDGYELYTKILEYDMSPDSLAT